MYVRGSQKDYDSKSDLVPCFKTHQIRIYLIEVTSRRRKINNSYRMLRKGHGKIMTTGLNWEIKAGAGVTWFHISRSIGY